MPSLVLKLIKLVCEVIRLTSATTAEKEPKLWVDVMFPIGKLLNVYPGGFVMF